MLSDTHTQRAASCLVDRMGEIAIAAAVLRAQQAASQGRFEEMGNWRRIAAAAAERLNVN